MSLEEICLACGLCCEGELHSKADLREEEREVMVHLGAMVAPDGASFRLPCPVHDGSACTAYETRPQVCRDYECEVRRSVRLGERSADEAMQMITTLKQKVADVEVYVGGRDTGSPLNHRLTRFLADTPQDDPAYNIVKLKAIVLNIERAQFDMRAYQDPRDLGK